MRNQKYSELHETTLSALSVFSILNGCIDSLQQPEQLKQWKLEGNQSIHLWIVFMEKEKLRIENTTYYLLYHPILFCTILDILCKIFSQVQKVK